MSKVITFEKPMLACDFEVEKLEKWFAKGKTLLAFPKYDGVRGIVDPFTFEFVGRSRKAPANLLAQQTFSSNILGGLDGEAMVSNLPVNHEEQCRKTSSALSTIDGLVAVTLHCFDDLTLADEPFKDRHASMVKRVEQIKETYPQCPIDVIKWREEVNTVERVFELYEEFLNEGYEGIVLRDPNAKHKNNRSTPTQCGYLRLKPTGDAEAVVVAVIEGEHNANEATIDGNGYTERSTHQENMIPNGMVGSLVCRSPKYPMDFKVGPGKLTHVERKYYFENQNEIIHRVITYKFMDYGEKDKPRQARFKNFRNKEDIDTSGA